MKFGLNDQEIQQIKTVFENHKEIGTVLIFGSRALNTFQPASDIDLVLKGDINFDLLAKVKGELEELSLPYFFDVVDYSDISNAEFKEHIDKHGKIFYLRGWREVRLGDVGITITGKTPSKDNPEDWGDFLDFITPTDIVSDSKYLGSVARKLSENGVNRFQRMIIPSGSVVVTCIGSDMGKVVINKNSALTNQQINAIKVNAKNDRNYIYYYLKNSYPVLRNIAVGGSTMPILNKSTFESLGIFLPPLPEQRAIAAVLSSLDDKIELLREQNKTLEALAQAIFKEWFVNFEFPVNSPPLEGCQAITSGVVTSLEKRQTSYRSSGGKMIDSELGKIPEGWRVGGIYEYLEVDFGFPFKSELFNENKIGLPLIRIRDLKDGTPVICTNEECSENYIVYPGDVLAGMDAEFRAVIWKGERALLNQRVCRFRPREKVGRIFILEIMKPHLNFFEKTKSGSTISHLGKSDLDAVQTIIPPKKIIREFSNATEAIIQKIILNNSQIQTLSALRDTLLPKLMKGEVRVNRCGD